MNLIGQRFGRLTVIERLDDHKSPNGRTTTMWLCECDCGNHVKVSRNSLRSGHVKSCGCYQKDRVREKKFVENEYTIRGNYVIGLTTNTHREFYFDLDDFDKVKCFHWYENDQGYILAVINRQHIRMHRFILNIHQSQTPIVDHINGNRADNRKNNLRTADKSTNGINRRCNRNNSLGVKGVTKGKNNRYYASIMKNGQTISLGGHNTLQEATEARERAERELFGEYAYVK